MGGHGFPNVDAFFSKSKVRVAAKSTSIREANINKYTIIGNRWSIGTI